MKIRITEEQLRTIFLNEQKNHLKNNKYFLNETFYKDAEILEEGWREVVLGVSMLLGVGLTGPNKAIAQDALKNDETMAQIKSTLENREKTDELVDLLKQQGLKDPDSLLAKNAQNVVNKFNKLADENDLTYKVSTKVVDNLEKLSSELKQGYALKKSDIKTDTIKGDVKVNTKSIVIKDTIEVSFGNDKTFVTGGYTISPEGVKEITDVLNDIKNTNGKIISANIESSTDAESVPKFRNENDPTGNIKLATLRTKSISDLLNNIDGEIDITHVEIPDNGSDVVNAKQFKSASSNPEELAKLRIKTSEFRYVKLTMVVEFESNVEKGTVENPVDVVRNYRFELVKVFDIDKGRGGGKGGGGFGSKGRTKISFPKGKLSCGGGGKIIKCFTKF
jgi:hypothetical protein